MRPPLAKACRRSPGLSPHFAELGAPLLSSAAGLGRAFQSCTDLNGVHELLDSKQLAAELAKLRLTASDGWVPPDA